MTGSYDTNGNAIASQATDCLVKATEKAYKPLPERQGASSKYFVATKSATLNSPVVVNDKESVD